MPGGWGQLVLLLALGNCALWDSIFRIGKGEAGVAAGARVVVVVGGSSGKGGFAGVCVASPCPLGVTEPGIHGLGRASATDAAGSCHCFIPKGTGSCDGTDTGTAAPGAPAGQGVPLHSPSPAVLSAILFFEVI